jgi:isoleucyl-tRNA synthetase
VALATEVTPELEAEGLAREFVHWVQQARKNLNFDYADRILIFFKSNDAMKIAVDIHRDWIKGETLADDFTYEGSGSIPGDPTQGYTLHDLIIRLEKVA